MAYTFPRYLPFFANAIKLPSCTVTAVPAHPRALCQQGSSLESTHRQLHHTILSSQHPLWGAPAPCPRTVLHLPQEALHPHPLMAVRCSMSRHHQDHTPLHTAVLVMYERPSLHPPLAHKFWPCWQSPLAMPSPSGPTAVGCARSAISRYEKPCASMPTGACLHTLCLVTRQAACCSPEGQPSLCTNPGVCVRHSAPGLVHAMLWALAPANDGVRFAKYKQMRWDVPALRSTIVRRRPSASRGPRGIPFRLSL